MTDTRTTSQILSDHRAEHIAYAWAVREQGYDGTYADWRRLSAAERAEYEDGAAGIGTV